MEAVRGQMGQESPSLQIAALRTLAALNEAAAVQEAIGCLASKQAGVQREAVAILKLSAEGAKKVGRRWLDGKLPAALRPEVLSALAAHAARDADCAKLLAAVKKGKARP